MQQAINNGKVLIVDDNPVNIQLIRQILEMDDYQTESAKSGQQALDLISEFEPDLILLDVMMPEMDGYETCRRLKMLSDYKDIPVIFVTAKGAVQDIAKGFEMGAVDYITKPIFMEDVLARVRTHVQLYLLNSENKTLLDKVIETNSALVDKNKELRDANYKIKETQAMLLQKEKMASIGVMAAGIAHEINNPMGFINSNMGSLARYVDKMIQFSDDQAGMLNNAITSEISLLEIVSKLKVTAKQSKIDFIKEDLKAIVQDMNVGVERVSTIIQSLLKFSQGGKGNSISACDINDCIKNTLLLLENQKSEGIQIGVDYGDVATIQASTQQLNHSILHILNNAVQAINDTGEITIKTWNAEGYVMFSIADDGVGIADDVMGHIFEPFFTTKEVGQGKGLGLSVVYDFVNKHYGKIDVVSQDSGTVITIALPVRSDPVS